LPAHRPTTGNMPESRASSDTVEEMNGNERKTRVVIQQERFTTSRLVSNSAFNSRLSSAPVQRQVNHSRPKRETDSDCVLPPPGCIVHREIQDHDFGSQLVFAEWHKRRNAICYVNPRCLRPVLRINRLLPKAQYATVVLVVTDFLRGSRTDTVFSCIVSEPR